MPSGDKRWKLAQLPILKCQQISGVPAFVGPRPDVFQICVNDKFPLLLSPQIMTAAPQQFWVDILPVDDSTPRIVTNLGLQWLEYMDGKVRPFHLPQTH